MNRKRTLIAFALLMSTLIGTTAVAWARHSRHGGSSGQAGPPAQTVSLSGGHATVAFSPNGDATNVVVDAIEGARKQVLVQAYGFTNVPIIDALDKAKARGVDVEVILDKSNDTGKYSGATTVINHGIPVWIDETVTIAHNKVMIIDGENVITGSFNFTKAAQEKNAENVLYLTHVPDLAALYIKNWMWRKDLSQVY